MYRTNPDFVFTVTRDFVRSCQTPVLILPDDVPAHPYAVAMEAAMLAPNAEVSMFPWKEPKERDPAGGAPDPVVPARASAGGLNREPDVARSYPRANSPRQAGVRLPSVP